MAGGRGNGIGFSGLAEPGVGVEVEPAAASEAAPLAVVSEGPMVEEVMSSRREVAASNLMNFQSAPGIPIEQGQERS